MLNLELWTSELRTRLPGHKAQERMAPSFRVEFPQQPNPYKAAVMALMYPSGGKIYMVFIKRNEYDGPHSAQVSFPGGACEAGDLSPEGTALRETREELGIEGRIEVLGSLTELYIPVSNFQVTPYVGWLDHTPDFKPDKTEVQYVIETSLEDLLSPLTRSSEILLRHGHSIEAPYYKVAGEKIWGATAMILSEFLEFASRMR